MARALLADLARRRDRLQLDARLGRIPFTQLPGTIWTMNAGGTGLRKLTAATPTGVPEHAYSDESTSIEATEPGRMKRPSSSGHSPVDSAALNCVISSRAAVTAVSRSS